MTKVTSRYSLRVSYATPHPGWHRLWIVDRGPRHTQVYQQKGEKVQQKKKEWFFYKKSRFRPAKITKEYDKHKAIFDTLRLKNPLPPSDNPGSSPSLPIFDTPVEAFGVGIKAVQKGIMDERHVLMNAYMPRRTIELPFDDPRRRALLEILYNEFATHLLTGLPVQGVLFKPAK